MDCIWCTYEICPVGTTIFMFHPSLVPTFMKNLLIKKDFCVYSSLGILNIQMQEHVCTLSVGLIINNLAYIQLTAMAWIRLAVKII